MPLPPEIKLAADPFTVNGRAIEAVLYKEQLDCPICFLGYPPYLNKTRCCDQPICSECFVQIKRPDPHPPEHHGDESNPAGPDPVAAAAAAVAAGNEEFTLVSEPATCPYCKMPEFGITYEPPPFRRGLAYATSSLSTGLHGYGGSHSNMNHLLRSAMSSSSSINSSVHSSNHAAQAVTPIGGASTPTGSTATRHRRNQSVSADAPSVITTDRIRPDWAKKLADMRAHALRRAAAATALHNAAYMLGNLEAQGYGRGESSRGGITMFRRRRGLFGGNGAGGPGEDNGLTGFLANNAPRQGSEETLANNGGNPQGASAGDIFPGRMSSLSSGGVAGAIGGGQRRSRMEDLEELMMMEAIRQSIAAEEERKKKEDAEKAKKEQDERAKGGVSSESTMPLISMSIPTVGAVVPPSVPQSATSTHAHPLSMSMSPETTSSARSSTSDLHAHGVETSGSSPSPALHSTTTGINAASQGKGKQAVITGVEHHAGSNNTDNAVDKVVEGKGKGKESTLGV
jgi:hypothetical protein